MITSQLFLPVSHRGAEPRQRGLTVVIDGGLSLGALEDVVASAGEYIDLVKFGWGTAIVSGQTSDASSPLLRDAGIGYYFGGTLFEKFVLQDRFDDFRTLCHELWMRVRGGLERDRSTCRTTRRPPTSASWPASSRSSARSASRTASGRSGSARCGGSTASR